MPELEDQPAAVEAITYALNSEKCVLDFRENENGEMVVTDITEHVESLEELVNNDN